jgi:hypothetical protein
VPPLAGAALDLSWWITLLLVAPATVCYLAMLGRLRLGDWAWERVPIAYALPGIIVIALVVPGLPSLHRYAGCFAAALLIGADLLRGGDNAWGSSNSELPSPTAGESHTERGL